MARFPSVPITSSTPAMPMYPASASPFGKSGGRSPLKNDAFWRSIWDYFEVEHDGIGASGKLVADRLREAIPLLVGLLPEAVASD